MNSDDKHKSDGLIFKRGSIAQGNCVLSHTFRPKGMQLVGKLHFFWGSVKYCHYMANIGAVCCIQLKHTWVLFYPISCHLCFVILNGF